MDFPRKVDYRPRTMKAIIPSDILKSIAKNGDDRQKDVALHTMSLSSFLRGRRTILGPVTFATALSADVKRRTVYDMQTDGDVDNLPGKRVRGEGDPESSDLAVNEAYEGSGATYDMYKDLFQRNSINNNGMPLNSSVHFDKKYDNAFWDGRQMVYGDGDGDIFATGCFTHCIDVIGHEMSHGVTENESNLIYRGQSGALNESFSDCMGIMLKQRVLGQTAEKADWLIGEGMFTPKVHGVSLRSMKEPGTAFDDPVLGKDPQPGHMKNFVKTTRDNGGVHINSGIPNHAFCLVAIELGGNTWDKAGPIWYNAFLKGNLPRNATFEHAAKSTFKTAGRLYGEGGPEQKAVKNGWTNVGVKIK